MPWVTCVCCMLYLACQLLAAAESPQNLPFPICLSIVQVQCHLQDKPLDGRKLEQLQQCHQPVQQTRPYQQPCTQQAADAAQNQAHSQASSGVAAAAATFSPAAALSSELATPQFSGGGGGRSPPEAQRMARMQRNRYSGHPLNSRRCATSRHHDARNHWQCRPRADPLLLSAMTAQGALH